MITIAGIYNDPTVPRFAIESIMFHEMLHIAIPPFQKNGRNVIHGSAFRQAEKTFPHYHTWRQWCAEQLPEIVRKRSRRK